MLTIPPLDLPDLYFIVHKISGHKVGSLKDTDTCLITPIANPFFHILFYYLLNYVKESLRFSLAPSFLQMQKFREIEMSSHHEGHS